MISLTTSQHTYLRLHCRARRRGQPETDRPDPGARDRRPEAPGRKAPPRGAQHLPDAHDEAGRAAAAGGAAPGAAAVV